MCLLTAGLAVALVATGGLTQTPTDSARALTTVTVKAKPDVEKTLANPTKFDLFLERKKIGGGFFLTHDQIVARNASNAQQLLQGVPGIKVRRIGRDWLMQSQRCSGGHLPGMSSPEMLDTLTQLFIDGNRVSAIDALDDIQPSEIEALEVYQGAAQLPAEARGRGCFAIFIWIRTIGR